MRSNPWKTAGLLALAGLAHGWTSPGTGLVCTPDVLVAQSGGALTGTWPDYTQQQAILISSGDELRLPAGTRWTVAADVELRVQGLATALGTPWETIELRSASGAPDSWSGLVLDDADPASHLRCVTLSHGDDGLNCLGSSPLVEACTLTGNLSSGLSCFLGGNPVLRHCLIEGNRRYGVEVTGDSSPVLEHCVIRGNNTEASSPRNAVSVGIQGSNNPVLRSCRLEGLGPTNPASGFSHWMAGDPLLEDCEITGFRSGVVIQGAGAQGRLERVWIHSSRYSNPTLGGSGINVNTSAAPVFRGCCIEDNDWGVTLTSACAPDFGSAADLGDNRLHGNGNGGSVWDFYHNTSGTVQARGNWWGTTDPATVELHIHDSADGTFGDVVTDPLRADSLYAPFLSPDTGLFALLEGDTLTLEPATRFRALPGTSYALEGPGTAWDDGTLLRWLPPAGSDSLFTLALRATPSVGPEAVDTLRVWLRRAGFTAPQLVCRTQGADLVLEWTEVAGATAYRLERSSHPAFPAEEVVVLQEGPGRDFTDPAVLGPGQAWYRVVALQ